MAPSLDAEERVKQFKETHKVDIPIASDAQSVFTAYGMNGPDVVLVGKDGKIVWTGKSLDAAFKEAVTKAMAEK